MVGTSRIAAARVEDRRLFGRECLGGKVLLKAFSVCYLIDGQGLAGCTRLLPCCGFCYRRCEQGTTDSVIIRKITVLYEPFSTVYPRVKDVVYWRRYIQYPEATVRPFGFVNYQPITRQSIFSPPMYILVPGYDTTAKPKTTLRQYLATTISRGEMES